MESVNVDLDQGRATLQATNLPVLDFGEIPNAIAGMRPPVPASVTFRVEWSGPAQRTPVRNADPVYGRFVGEFVYTSARIEWTARAGDYEFRSAPIETSMSQFALLGLERNGIFFA